MSNAEKSLRIDDAEELDALTYEVGAVGKKHARGQIGGAESVGEFEQGAIQAGSRLTQPLDLSDKFLTAAGPHMGSYQASYNLYTAPLRTSVRALGRVKDVQMTGAPLVPAELEQNAALSKKVKRGNAAAQNIYDDWSDSQSSMVSEAKNYSAGIALVRAAIDGYTAARMKLDRRAKEAELAGKSAQKAEIDRAAETLAEITKMAAVAWSGAAEIDAALAVGIDPVASEETAAKLFKANDGVEHVETKSASAHANEKTQEVINRLKAHGTAAISLEDLFIVGMGKAGEYEKLERAIAKLEGQISELEFATESQEINAATSSLRAFNIDLVARSESVGKERTMSRRRAATFASALGGGEEMKFAMYAAEAYQELDLFGTIAHQQRIATVDPRKPDIVGYLERYSHDMERHGFHLDRLKLSGNLTNIDNQRQFFAERLPEWQGRASAWRIFLKARMGDSLIVNEQPSGIASPDSDG
jgi:hypothetical protein